MRAPLFTAPAQRQLSQEFALPAPTLGIDTNQPLYNTAGGNAIYLYNLTPGDYGLRTREGWRTWVEALNGGACKSLIPFIDNQLSGANARLFAVTQNGISDVTTQGQSAPPLAVTFADQTSEAGFTSYHHVTSPAGAQTIYVADSRNGLYEYNPVGTTWTKLTTEITGVDPTKVAFVMGHKGRLWFIERDSADAWYLPVGQKTGAAVKFQFGAKMRHGGYLVGLYTYSYDGGSGLDDYLVAVSKGGDVQFYQGTDPAQASSWQIVGNWYIGDIPAGRRIAMESGGDLLLLSSYGVTSASSLLRGVDPSIIERNVTGKIYRIVQDALKQKGSLPYWEIKSIVEEGVFAINVPTLASERPIQYTLYVNRTSEGPGGGWGFWRDLPATTFEPYQGNAYFGTTDGKVAQMTGDLDAVALAGGGGDPVEFSILTGYTDLQMPGRYKQIPFLRATFLAENQITYNVKPLFDFDLSEITSLGVPSGGSGDRWDVGRWDEAVWTGTSSVSGTIGANGYGRNVAVAIKGEAISRALLVNIEGMAQPWAFL